MKYVTLFEDQNSYDKNSAKLDLPNISYILSENKCLFKSQDKQNEITETKIVITYNINDINYDSKLCKIDPKNIDSIEIDGVDLLISSYYGDGINYRFDTIGKHIVKYVLKDMTIIPNTAFNGIHEIVSIYIPDSIINIEQNAFNNCSNLEEIELSKNLLYINTNVFSSCYNLTSIIIPNSVIFIGDYAFNNCNNLTSITIPNSVTSIGNNAFNNCNNLTSITIPNSVTTIGNAVFNGCYNLTSIIILASTPPSIQGGSLISNFGITYIYVPSEYIQSYLNAYQNLSNYILPIQE